jgi:small-conductance mechanosensitive channel
MQNIDLHAWFNADSFAGNSLNDLLIALASALIAYLVMTTGLRFARRRIHSGMAGATADDPLAVGQSMRPVLMQVLDRTSHWLLLGGAVLLGLHLLDLPARWETRVSQLWFVTVALQVALWGTKLIEVLLQRYLLRHAGPAAASATVPPQATVSATLIGWALQTALWTVVALAVLSNLGFNITAFIASLGIGGIAVALAAQNILGDLFASVSIALDKPFEVGDAIASGSVAGTVEHVGLKTTRLRSASGEQIVVSNTELIKDSLKNYKRMQTRRIEFKFGITYSATPEQAAAVPEIVRRVIEAQPEVKFDRAHFTSFGESSLDYVVVYIMQTADYGVYMDTQQTVNIALMREFAAIGVEFAFPTRTVQLLPAPATETQRGSAETADDNRKKPRVILEVAH